MAPRKEQFRRVMGQFATGVTIVTCRSGDEPHGMTANAVASVSLDPPLVLVCVDRAADTHDIIDRGGAFALNILGRDQEELSRRFADKDRAGAHRLDGVPYSDGATGAPVLDGSLASLDCRVVERYPGGDHTIFLGEVVQAAASPNGEPLIFYRGRYTRLA